MRVLLFTEIDLDDRAVLQMQQQIQAHGRAPEGEILEQAICEGMVRAADMFYKQLPGVQAHQTVYLPPLIRKVGL